MKKKVSLNIAVAMLVLITLSVMALAVDKSDTVSGGSLTEGVTGRITSTAAGSHGAQAGNVTELNVTTARSTAKWAGFFGALSASLRLGIGSDVLYDFGSVVSSQIKTVFAAPDSAFDFSNLLNASPADVDSAWGFPTAHADSATNTFTVSGQTVAQVSNVKAVGLNAFAPTGVGPSSNATLSTQVYNSSLFADTATPTQEFDFAFGVKVVTDQRDFRNQTDVDYELVVPVNTSGLGGTQTYFFFLDVE